MRRDKSCGAERRVRHAPVIARRWLRVGGLGWQPAGLHGQAGRRPRAKAETGSAGECRPPGRGRGLARHALPLRPQRLRTAAQKVKVRDKRASNDGGARRRDRASRAKSRPYDARIRAALRPGGVAMKRSRDEGPPLGGGPPKRPGCAPRRLCARARSYADLLPVLRCASQAGAPGAAHLRAADDQRCARLPARGVQRVPGGAVGSRLTRPLRARHSRRSRSVSRTTSRCMTSSWRL